VSNRWEGPCEVPGCPNEGEMRIKAKPPYRFDEHNRLKTTFWVCRDHGDKLVEKGYETDGRLF